MRIPVFVQNRHIHLSQIDADRLFGRGYVFSVEKKLTQTWEYVVSDKLVVKWNSWVLEDIDIVLPFRKFTQIEISDSDKKKLWIDAQILKSWDLKHAWEITIIWPMWSIYLSHCVIIPEKHIHMSVADAKDFWLRNNQIVSCIIPWKWWIVIDNVRIRSNDKYVFDMHLNIDDWLHYWLKTGDWVELKR